MRWIDDHEEQQRRALRRRIARSRRRIDRRVVGFGRAVRGLGDWRSYARRFPGATIAAAFTLGLAISVGFRGEGVFRRLGGRLFRATSSLAAGLAWRAVRQAIMRQVNEATSN